MAKRKTPKGCYWRNKTLWGRCEIAGREYRWSLGTDDPKIAESRLKAGKARLIAFAKYGDGRRTWDEAVVAWGEQIGTNVAAKTVRRYATSLAQINDHLKGCYLDEIDKALIGGIVRDRRAKGVTNATIRRDLGAIGSVLKYCEANEWPGATNPTQGLMQHIKERRDPIVLPEPAHIETVIARSTLMFGAMVRVAWKTGCRQEELASLERSRIDLMRRQATVIGKGNKLRTIDLFAAYEPLRDAPAHPASRFVFWHDDGAGYRNVATRFAKITAAAQRSAQPAGSFRRFRFHDLRHRFAVDFLKEGRGSIYDLQQHLGHTSVKTTEIYLKYLTPEESLSAMRGSAQNRAQMHRFVEVLD
jgi:integrase/recombinase XerD